MKEILHLVLSFPFVWLSNFVCYVGLFKSFYGEIHLFLLILIIYFGIHTLNSNNFQFIDLLVIIIMANLNILPTPHNNLFVYLYLSPYIHHIFIISDVSEKKSNVLAKISSTESLLQSSLLVFLLSP